MSAEFRGEVIGYLRVSTATQGRSGLGEAAQREAVTRYAEDNRLRVAEWFTEVETGKGSNALAKRPQLQAALTMAKKTKARLVIAKLDRLARNVHFISGLMDTGVDFVAADMPTAERFQLHIFAALAEQEARMISLRTKAALKAAKDRGQVLGKHGRILAEQYKAEAVERALPLADTFAGLRAEGMTMRQMVAALNDRGIPSPAGGTWHLANLHRAMKRVEAAAA